MDGFLKLHRKLLDWQWFTDSNTLSVFIYCLLRATYKDRDVQSEKLKPGQFICSVNTICRDTGLSIAKVRTSLLKLEKTGEIAKRSQGNYSIISISNWSKYQDSDNQTANESQSDDNQIATNYKGRREEGKNNNISGSEKSGESQKRKGTKLSDDWSPLDQDVEYAKGKGWSDARIDDEAQNFLEYYTNGKGRSQTSPDWSRRWQTWVRKDYGAGKWNSRKPYDPMKPNSEGFAERQARINRGLING